MDEELERRAGKPPEDAHPIGEGGPRSPDQSDYADPRVAQVDEDPPEEQARRPVNEDFPG